MCFEYEPADVWESRVVKARRDHHCGGCRRPIAAGELYVRERWLFEGSWDTQAVCGACELTIVRVGREEVAAGCPAAESWISPADLAEHLRETEMVPSTSEEGQAHLAERLERQRQQGSVQR